MGSVGEMLKYWRSTRRMSQLELAHSAEVSQRHLSHLETGKSHPSQQMVLVLASALDVPLRERNTLLMAAGYAPAYRETDLDAPEMAQVRKALEFLLNQAEPYGAVVVDSEWNVLMANRAMQAMTSFLLGDPPPATARNLMHGLFDPQGYRPYIVDWDTLACAMLKRLHREAATEGDSRLYDLFDALRAYPGVPDDWAELDLHGSTMLLVPFQLEKDGLRLNLFSTITTLGTPVDLTLQDLRIETYFAADESTEAALRALSAQLLET